VGVGLGLTIVKKIVERHGGRLEIDSLLGRGTTIVMVLPLQAQPHPDDELLRENLRAEASASPPGAEDTRAVRNRIADRWSADAGRKPNES
jgi:hypothetical protein